MKAWAVPAVVIFACAAFIFGVIFMPAAELLPAQLQHGPLSPGLSPIRSYDGMQQFKKIGDFICNALDVGPNIESTLQKPVQDRSSLTALIPGAVRSYAIYAVFLAGSMILAAIAINAIGRWDSEEKTTIPIKK